MASTAVMKDHHGKRRYYGIGLREDSEERKGEAHSGGCCRRRSGSGTRLIGGGRRWLDGEAKTRRLMPTAWGRRRSRGRSEARRAPSLRSRTRTWPKRML